MISLSMVNLIVTEAPLLSGSLRDCAQIEGLNSPSPEEDAEESFQNCSTGGLATVNALRRFYSQTTNSSDVPTLVIPMGDFKAPLTIMSRFRFGVNTMIFGELGFRTWTLPAYTLHNGRFEEDTLYDAQDPNFPALVSNVVTSPEELAHPYIRSIHFDPETQLAVLYLTKEYLVNTHSQRQTVQRLLQYIYKRNQANGCNLDEQSPAYSAKRSGYSAFFSPTITKSPMSSSGHGFSDWFKANPDPNRNITFPIRDSHIPENCFIPVVIFDDKDSEQYDLLIESLQQPTNAQIVDTEGNGQGIVTPTLRPHLLVDLYGHGSKSTRFQTPHNDADADEGSVWIRRTLDFNSTIPMTTADDDVDSTSSFSSSSSLDSITSSWIVSYRGSPSDYHQIEIDIATDARRIKKVHVTHEDLNNPSVLSSLSPSLSPQQVVSQSSSEFIRDLDRLRQYAREALQSSLINEPGVRTATMRPMTNPEDGYRQCYVGECEVGNLVTDALRWVEQTDVALLPSFLFNGPGWEAGEIRILELLENIPYTAPRCTATLKGNSLLRVLQHSIATTSFGPYDGVQQGGRLLQVSGMRMVYSHAKSATTTTASGNIFAVDVWDRDQEAYLPLNRTRLYSVASNNHLCFTFSDFPDYFGSLLVEEGEVMAIAHPDTEIKSDTKNYLIAKYANRLRSNRNLDDNSNSSSTDTYQPQLEGRHQQVTDTSSSSAVPLVVHEAFHCIPGITYWDSSILECSPCPSFDGVSFSDDRAQLQGRAYGTNDIISHEMVLTNQESFPIRVNSETLTLPENIQLMVSLQDQLKQSLTDQNISNTGTTTDDEIYVLDPNDSIAFNIYFDPSQRNPGVDTSSLVFGISEVSRSGLCSSIKIKYEIEVQLTQSRESNMLDGVASFGYTSATVIILTSLFFASWVYRRRKTRLVAAMQPFFLITLCLGVLLIGSSLIPLSIDDSVAKTERGINMACMARPWLLVMGFSICVAALFSKLFRINKLFSAEQFRRVKITEQDVMWPTIILILLNFILLLVWTIADPIQWERLQVPGQPWKTYGTCQLGDGNVANAILWTILSLCAISFFLTVWQAFLARNISSEFSESKYLGIAVFSWVQLLMVGVPVLFLVEDDNVLARYSLVVGLLVAVCLSMLLVVFVPTILAHQERERNPRSNVIVTGVSNNGASNDAKGSSSLQHHPSHWNIENSAKGMLKYYAGENNTSYYNRTKGMTTGQRMPEFRSSAESAPPAPCSSSAGAVDRKLTISERGEPYSSGEWTLSSSTNHRRLSSSEKQGRESSDGTLHLPRISSSDESSYAEDVIVMINNSFEEEQIDDEGRIRSPPVTDVVDGPAVSVGSIGCAMRKSDTLTCDLETQGKHYGDDAEDD